MLTVDRTKGTKPQGRGLCHFHFDLRSLFKNDAKAICEWGNRESGIVVTFHGISLERYTSNDDILEQSYPTLPYLPHLPLDLRATTAPPTAALFKEREVSNFMGGPDAE